MITTAFKKINTFIVKHLEKEKNEKKTIIAIITKE